MTDFLTALKSQPLLADGAMGSYLFELTGRLSEPNHVYEAFNIEQPGLIEKVHLAYLNVGAQCLVTNTFGANRAKLGEYGWDRRVAEVNRAGVGVARRAISQFQAQSRAAGPFFVLGSIGPTPQELTDRPALEVCYREQIEALIEGGADALIFETFSSLE
jgi:homocysteine S-methyltransferase